MTNNYPFSKQLNEFVEAWFTDNQDKFKEYPSNQFNLDDAEKTFKEFQNHYVVNGTVPMWYDTNEDNIFGCAIVNAKFRAWHDYMHIITNNDFSLNGEKKVYAYQKRMFPESWWWERLLIKSEIVEQAKYYTKTKVPIPNQREFTLMFIENIENGN